MENQYEAMLRNPLVFNHGNNPSHVNCNNINDLNNESGQSSISEPSQ